tara:strand:+ start:210 stop:377 length:168 start_codon:yes stop_codon:yes gene_type:complete
MGIPPHHPHHPRHTPFIIHHLHIITHPHPPREGDVTVRPGLPLPHKKNSILDIFF